MHESLIVGVRLYVLGANRLGRVMRDKRRRSGGGGGGRLTPRSSSPGVADEADGGGWGEWGDRGGGGLKNGEMGSWLQLD